MHKDIIWLFSALFTVTLQNQRWALTDVSVLLPSRCFLVLVSQYKLQSLRDGHATTTVGEEVPCGNPPGEPKCLGGMQGHS